jgi:hypothetical protein
MNVFRGYWWRSVYLHENMAGLCRPGDKAGSRTAGEKKVEEKRILYSRALCKSLNIEPLIF